MPDESNMQSDPPRIDEHSLHIDAQRIDTSAIRFDRITIAAWKWSFSVVKMSSITELMSAA